MFYIRACLNPYALAPLWHKSRRQLENISIGPKRKKLLLEKLGSVSAIAEASETELGKLIGASASKALREQLA